MINIATIKNVNIGAHPSYPDKENFGRIEMDIDSNELLDLVRDQVQLLVDIAENNGGHVSHVNHMGLFIIRLQLMKKLPNQLVKQ